MHKRNAVRAALRGKRVAIAVAAAFVPLGEAYSLPTGEQLVHGQVSVTRPDAVTMQINQGTQKGIVNWTGFSINGNEHVNITQPNSAASLLNRVVGNDPSNIFGRLTANGQVFLVNNAGVFFAPGASVNAAAIVASTLSITDQSFLDNTYQFFNPGNAGSVVNQGSIVTAGGFTALIGPQVRNDGIILANSGKIALGAGNRVSLDMIGDGLVSISVDEAAFNASVINTGTLQADGGTVMLKASSANALLDTVINTSGVIRASGLGLENGVIVLHGGDAGTVQVAGLVQAESGRIEIAAGGALNVGSTVCCSPTTVIAATEQISAGSVTVGGGAQIVGNTGAGSQTITTPGTLLVRGGTVSGNVGIFHNGTGEQRVTAGNVEVRGGIGTNTAAFINSTGGGDQTLTVTGELRVTGGASGTGNRAGIVTNANQTINGNPDIVLTGGAGGGAGNASNNVFIQATGPDTTQQTINARTIQITAGTGTDASATFNAARQVVNTLGNVSIFGSGGPGGSNGARIGGIGGTTLGPTNLTLNVGGNLLLRGGTVNGASLGSSGASTQANTITVNATGDVTLESQGAGARIGSSNQTPVPAGNISVTAGGDLELGTGTAVRANGPITLTASSLTSDGTITNGGGASTNNIVLSANAFDLAGGNIQGGAAAVVLRPRTGTNSFGIEAAGDTTLTNADIASINTSNFVVFGSGMGTIFTGNMAIGQNAPVQGGDKHLAFFRSTAPGGTTTIGSQGVATTGDVIVSAGGGAIVSNGGTVAGDEIQLRAAQGIGASDARVSTAANALAINNTGVAGSFVSDAHGVTLRTVSLNVGGNQNTFGTLTGGALDLDVGGVLNVAGVVQSAGTMSINAVGTLNVIGAGTQDGILISSGGQAITAHAVNLTAQDGRRANIENNGGNQSIAAMGDMNLQVPGAFGVAQIVNNAPGGNQTITASGPLTVLGGANTSGSTNSGIFKNGAGGLQTVTASGITLQGANTGTRAGALISSQSDQVIDVTGGNINIFGGNGGNLNNAAILASAAGQQTIRAHDINLANGFGGIDTVAGIQAGHQLIEATGNVTLTSQGAILGAAAGGPGVRIGAPQNTPAGSDITLRVGGNLTLNGGTVAENGAAIGSSGAGVAAPNTIFIDASGSVTLNAGDPQNTGVRIGSGSGGTAGGNITIQADGGIALNGTQRSAAIRTTDNVTLQAASISEQGNGFILANALTTTTSGATNLAGPNQVSSYSGSTSFFGSDLTLNNSGPLTITSLNAGGNLALTNTGNVNVTGLSFSFGSMNVSTTGGNLMLTSALSSGNAMTLDIGGTLTVSANGPQSAQLIANSGGQTIAAQSVEVVAQNGGFATITNIAGGEQRITINGGGAGAGLDVHTLTSGGSAQISNQAAGFAQTIEVTNADHINVNGAGSGPFPGAGAAISTFGGAQSLSITGSGANAITVGSVGARGASSIGGGLNQSVTAGLAGQQGSITIVGADAPATFVGISNGFASGLLNTQNVSTSGALTIRGGNSPFQPPAGPPPATAFSATGISHNASGTQTIQAGALVLQGGSGINNNAFISSNQGGSQSITSGSVTLIGGASGQNNSAIINSSTGGNQSVTVSGGAITVTGGAGGLANRAGIVTNANQTISGNPDIVLTGGAGGGAGNNSNNVFIQATGPDTTQQTINARRIEIRSGAGTDASATFNAARQVINTTGDVSIFGGAGPGGSNGARIGGIGGTTLGPTNLTLNVGGNLLLHGGTLNGASLGSSGASTQANIITVSAAGNITLESEGAGARIGSSNQTPVPSGNITVSAGGNFVTGTGTAVRANGPITLTANSLTNDGTITNGGGSNTANIIFNADAFNLAGGTIEGGAAAVVLRPRTGTNSFGIEAAAATTLTNADIASINTSNFVVFGSSTGTIFTGNMTIGQNARVEGNGKSLAFSRSLTPSAEMIIIGSQGVATTGDVIFGAGGGGIRSNGGTITGDEVQLRASNGIGTPSARVNTAANALAINNAGGGGVFVSELDNVTLRTISLNVGGTFNTASNTNNGSFSLISGGDVNVAGLVSSGGSMILDAGGNLKLDATSVDAELRSLGGQTISAQSIDLTAQNGRRAIIQNMDGNQSVTATTGDMNLQVPGGSGVAQIVNISNLFSADQTISANGQLNVLGGAIAGPIPSTNSGIFKSNAVGLQGGLQTVRAAGITLQGANTGTRAGALISSQGDQLVDVTGGNINIFGGNGGNINNAAILASAAGQQTIRAHDINLANGFGGIDTVAAIQAGHQLIEATGNVTLTSQGAILGAAAGGPGVRIGAPQNTPAGSDITLRVGGNLTLNGGTVAENGAAIGSSGAGTAAPNTIFIDAGGSVILNAGTEPNTGVRIGSGSNGTAGGNITILADGSIQLNGTQRSAAIRTLDSVTLDAASINQAGNGFILADALTTRTSGVTNLAGPNEIARFNGTSGGALTLVDSGALQVTGITTTNDAITLTTDSLTNSGTITNTGGAPGVANMVFVSDAFNLAGGSIDAGAAAVILRPRTGTNSFGIESAGDTTLTNADLASINTSNFVVFGSSMGTNFTGNMTIGENAQVDGGGKHLAFFRSINFGGTTTIGAQGVSTTGDVIVAAGNGAIVSNGGTVRGDEVQLKAGQSIGSAAARVQTAANALAINSGNAFISELDSLALRDITLNVGGITNFGNNVLGGALDLAAGGAVNVGGVVQSIGQNIDVAGALSLDASLQNAVLSSSGGQTITAHSIHQTAQNGFRANIENFGSGNQTITATAGDMNLQVPGGFGVAQIINNAPGANQTVTVNGQLSVLGGVISPATSRNSGIFKNGGAGLQTIKASGITLQGANTGTQAGALIVSQGDQFVDVTGGDINLIGGSGGNGNNAGIAASVTGQQTVLAHNINLSNGVGGIDTAATILGGHQLIDVTGNVTLTAQGALVSAGATALPGVRIGAPGGSTIGTDLTLLVDGNLVLNGGSAANNGAGIGSSSGGIPQQNTIVIDVGGSVILNSGTGANTAARIGSSSHNGLAGGNISVTADGSIELNGTGSTTSISTLGNVTLHAATISEASNGFILANSLTTTSTGGNTTLTGPNQVASYSGTSSANLSLNNTGALDVTGVNAGGDATLSNVGNVTVSGPWTAGGTSTITVASDIVLAALLTSSDVVLNAGGGSITETGAGAIVANTLSTTAGGTTSLTGLNQVASYSGSSGGSLVLNNGVALDITSLHSGGNALVTNAGNLTLTGAWNSASANITANAISQGAAGSIETGFLTASAAGAISLTGPNRIADILAANASGDITLNNIGALNVTLVQGAQDVAVTNAGTLTATGQITAPGALSVVTTGAGSDFLIRNFVTSGSAMDFNVAGRLVVSANGPQNATVLGHGQTINAGSIEVTSENGGFATLTTLGSGDQIINVSGGSIDVQALSGNGSAMISNNAPGGKQTITVSNGDHINVNGAGGFAFVNTSGMQTVSITGSGANAITLGSAGALGFSQFAGGSSQSFTAGLAGEQGSIRLVGPAANSAATSISNQTVAGGTQSIATSGLLSITGGTASSQSFGSGLFHAGSGQQTVKAGAIELRGGSSGAGNGVFINSTSGGDQVLIASAIRVEGGSAGSAGIFHNGSGQQAIEAGSVVLRGGAGGQNNGAFINTAGGADQNLMVSGAGITVTGGDGGNNNRAGIGSSGNQTINGNSDITLVGGAGGGALGSNNVFINGGPTKTQTINARHITLTSGAGGVNNSVTINGARQIINATGNVTLTGGGSTGQFSGVRIGGLSNPIGATDLQLNVGGNLLMTGGTAEFNGVGLGSNLSAPSQANNIAVNAGGDVILNPGSAAGARIGSSVLSGDVAGGTVVITAGGKIELNGNSEATQTAIRTTGNVALNAGSTISEGSHGIILADRLVTSSHGSTSLTGQNRVASFTASTSAGNVSLRNTAPVLTLGSMELPGSLSIVQAGTLSIPGTVSALSHAIDATGDVLVGSAGATNAALLYASGDISIETPGSVIVRGSDVTPLAASAVLADGNLQVAAGNVTIQGGGALLTPAAMRGEAVDINAASELRVKGGSGHLSPALLSSGSNINLTIGDAVRVDAGSGLLSFARIQTEIKNGVIHISFPDLARGGYFVNGVEGRTHQGETGFFTLNKPAKVGKTLLVDYGAP